MFDAIGEIADGARRPRQNDAELGKAAFDGPGHGGDPVCGDGALVPMRKRAEVRIRPVGA